MRAPNHYQALPSQQRHWQTPCKGQSEKIREACLVSQDMSKYDKIYSSTHGFWFLALVLGPRAIMSAKVPPLQSSMTLQMLWEAAAKVSFTSWATDQVHALTCLKNFIQFYNVPGEHVARRQENTG